MRGAETFMCTVAMSFLLKLEMEDKEALVEQDAENMETVVEL